MRASLPPPLGLQAGNLKLRPWGLWKSSKTLSVFHPISVRPPLPRGLMENAASSYRHLRATPSLLNQNAEAHLSETRAEAKRRVRADVTPTPGALAPPKARPGWFPGASGCLGTVPYGALSSGCWSAAMPHLESLVLCREAQVSTLQSLFGEVLWPDSFPCDLFPGGRATRTDVCIGLEWGGGCRSAPHSPTPLR